MPRIEEQSWMERQRGIEKPGRSVADLERAAAVEDDGQGQVITRIGDLRRPDTLELLAGYLGHTDPAVRAAAAVAVMRADPSAAAPLVVPLLADPERRVVKAAAGAFKVLAGPEHVPALAALVGYDDLDVQESIAIGLAATESVDALPHLAALLSSDRVFVRRDARRALRRSGIPGSAEVLAANPKRGRIRRARDARTARKAVARREVEPPAVVSTRSIARALIVNVAIDAVLVLAVPVLLGSASVTGSLIGLLIGLVVFGALLTLVMIDASPSESVAHDMARRKQRPVPDGAARHGTARVVLWGYRPAALVMTAFLVGIPALIEHVLPTGGLLSGALSAGLLLLAIASARSARWVGPAGNRTFRAAGRGAQHDRRVYLESAPS